ATLMSSRIARSHPLTPYDAPTCGARACLVSKPNRGAAVSLGVRRESPARAVCTRMRGRASGAGVPRTRRRGFMRSDHESSAGARGAARFCALLMLLAAAQAAAAHFSAEEALAYALAHSPRLAAAHEQAGAADARVRAAEAARWPQVQAYYRGQRSTNALDAFAAKLHTRTVDPATDFTAEALNHP